MSTVQIHPSVALSEAQALVEYYRNRCLIMAQAIADLRAQSAPQAPVDAEIIEGGHRMSLLTSYSTGTVSVGASSMTVTGSGTAWSTAGVEAGDYFWAAGLSVRIASVNSNTSLTLAYAWPGAALSGANYEVQFTPDATRNLASTRSVLEQLTNGNISALGGLATAPDTLAYYTGSGVAALTGLTSAARSLLDDTSVPAMRATLGVGSINNHTTFATYGGSDNAITATAGLTSLDNAQIRFRATAANTGAATINLDGLGAKACRTVTGVALPAGYIRTDADTLATYDGTYWVLDRAPEVGSNSNGQYLRLANGYQSCSKSLPAAGVSTTLIRSLWTYPAAFAAGSGPKVTATPDISSASGYADSASTRNYLGACGCMNISSGAVIVDQYKGFGAPDVPSSATITINAVATGVWY